MSIAKPEELQEFLQKHPEITMLEVLVPDINGILRGKRLPRGEFSTFFVEGVKAPGSVCLCNSRGEFSDDVERPD